MRQIDPSPPEGEPATLPLWALSISLGLLVVRLALAWRLELSPDEAYYWTWVKHPALSYVDHPPMVAWFIRAGTALLGDTELGVRLLGPIAVLLSGLLIAGSVRDLGGGRRAMVLALLFTELTIAANALAVIMTPDTPLLLFSALTLRLLARFIAGGSRWLWLAVGIAGGLALLSKYTAVMLGLGIGLWLLLVPERRRLFLTPWPWLGAGLALLVFAPVLVWNAAHGWVSFLKQGTRTLIAFTPSLRTIAEFLGGQLALATPAIALALLVGTLALAREGLAQRSDRGVLLPALVLPLLAYLMSAAIGQSVLGNWTLVVLPAATTAGALVLGEKWRTHSSLRRLGLAACAIGALFTVASFLYLSVPVASALGRRDISQRLSGHAAVATEVARLARAEGFKTVAAFDYGTAALLAFYLPKDIEAFQINDLFRYGRDVPPQAMSAFQGHGALALIDAPQAIYLNAYFAEVQEIERFDRRHRGATVETFIAARARGVRPDAHDWLCGQLTALTGDRC